MKETDDLNISLKNLNDVTGALTWFTVQVKQAATQTTPQKKIIRSSWWSCRNERQEFGGIEMKHGKVIQSFGFGFLTIISIPQPGHKNHRANLYPACRKYSHSKASSKFLLKRISSDLREDK